MTITETIQANYVGHSVDTYTILANKNRKFGNRVTVIIWPDLSAEIQAMTGNGKDSSFRHFEYSFVEYALSGTDLLETAQEIFNRHFNIEAE